MKNVLLFTFSFLLIFSCNHKSDSVMTQSLEAKSGIDEKAELDSIMKVIDNETKMFFAGNVEGWRSSWSHKDYTSQAWNNEDGTADIANGWDAINKQGSDWIEKYYKNGENVIHPDYKRADINVHFFSDKHAILSWKQYNADKDKKYFRISGESRIMEKETDGWKIVNVTGLWGIEPKISVDSLPANLH